MGIFLDTTQEPQQMKQVSIYADSLAAHIAVITAKLRQQDKLVREYAQSLNPPYYPISIEDAEARYHLNVIDLVMETSLRNLRDKMREITEAEWNACIAEYLNIPERSGSTPTTQQPGKVSPTVSDTLMDVLLDVGRYMLDIELKIPRFQSGRAEFSYKVVANVAIIWLGRRLQADEEPKKDNSPTASAK